MHRNPRNCLFSASLHCLLPLLRQRLIIEGADDNFFACRDRSTPFYVDMAVWKNKVLRSDQKKETFTDFSSILDPVCLMPGLAWKKELSCYLMSRIITQFFSWFEREMLLVILAEKAHHMLELFLMPPLLCYLDFYIALPLYWLHWHSMQTWTLYSWQAYLPHHCIVTIALSENLRHIILWIYTSWLESEFGLRPQKSEIGWFVITWSLSL